MRALALPVLVLSLTLAGCGGGGSSSPSPNPSPPPTFSIGFTVTGLSGSGLVMTGNGASVPVASNGSFTLGSSVQAGTAYSVSVQSQPTSPQQHCVVSNGTGTVSNANVTNILVECFAGKVVQGQVTDQPIPFAEVTVTVGDLSFSTTADGNGFYELFISARDPALIVLAAARGQGAQARVDLRSVVGPFGTLQTGNPNLNITNVSTARFVLMSLNDPVRAFLDSEGALIRAERGVDARELFWRATILKMLVDDPSIALPGGFNALLPFIRNGDSLFNALAAENGGEIALEQIRQSILSDPALVPAFTPDALGSEYLLVPATGATRIARQGWKLELGGGGAATMLQSNTLGGDLASLSFQGSWVLDAGALVLTYDPPVPGARVLRGQIGLQQAASRGLISFSDVQRLNNEGIHTARYESIVEEDRFRLLVAGSRYSPVHATRRARDRFESFEIDGDVISIADWVHSSTFMTNLWDLRRVSETGFSNSEVVGDWALYTWRASGPRHGDDAHPVDFFADFVGLTAGGSGSASKTPGFIGWSLDTDGVLIIEYGGGWTQRMTVLERSGPVFGVLIEVSHTAGERYATYHFITRRDPTLVADAAFFTNTGQDFWAAFTGLEHASYWIGNEIKTACGAICAGFALLEDGTARSRSWWMSSGAVSQSDTLFGSWTIEADGSVRINGTIEIFQESFPRVRRWVPLAVDAAGYLHVIESETWDGKIAMQPRIAVLGAPPPLPPPPPPPPPG